MKPWTFDSRQQVEILVLPLMQAAGSDLMCYDAFMFEFLYVQSVAQTQRTGTSRRGGMIGGDSCQSKYSYLLCRANPGPVHLTLFGNASISTEPHVEPHMGNSRTQMEDKKSHGIHCGSQSQSVHSIVIVRMSTSRRLLIYHSQLS